MQQLEKWPHTCCNCTLLTLLPFPVLTPLPAAQAPEERVQQQSGDEEAATTPLAGGAADAAAASSSAPDPDPAASAAELAQMKKINSSKDFYESHLMRASVLTPVEAEQERVRGAAAASHPPVRKTDTLVKPAAGEKTVAAAQDPTLSLADSLISGSVAMAAGTLTHHSAAANDGVSDEDEDENVHHAAGMGATAVSVLVRGNKVVVANTGAREGGGALGACGVGAGALCGWVRCLCSLETFPCTILPDSTALQHPHSAAANFNARTHSLPAHLLLPRRRFSVRDVEAGPGAGADAGPQANPV